MSNGTATVPPAPADAIAALDRFVEQVVVPLEEAHAPDLREPRRRFAPSGSYSATVLDLKRQVREAASAAGLYTLFVPRSLGGGGAGNELHHRVWERLYATAGPDRVLPYDAVAHVWGGPSPAMAGLSDRLRRDVLPGLMRGTTSLCSAFTEDPPSPDGVMQTRAVRTGGHWEITGAKHWVSRGAYADHALVYAVTDPERALQRAGGVTAFLVPTTSPGYQIDAVVTLFGRIGGEESTVTLHRVEATDDHIVGELHQGGAVSASIAPLNGTFTTGRFVGLAQWVLDVTVEALRESGEPVGSVADPTVAAVELADSAIEVQAARMLALDGARRLDRGDPAVTELAMARAYAIEMCGRVYERCFQSLDSVGLATSMRVFDGWHQVRILRSAGGGPVQAKRQVAQRLLAGEHPFPDAPHDLEAATR